MNLNDIIKQVLIDIPETRNSSRALIWEVYRALGIIESQRLFLADFLNLNTPHPSTIIRRARIIQKEDKYRPTVEKPYRRRRPKKDWDFAENVGAHVWDRYK